MNKTMKTGKVLKESKHKTVSKKINYISKIIKSYYLTKLSVLDLYQ